jgi:GrpB-like predicted nucleotidyltransferase (UPF0157 family)
MSDPVRPGYGRTYPIAIAVYDPAWPERFEAEAERIREALGAAALRIDHIGSTAVPGLAAKPVIDIQVSVERVGDDEPYVAPLVALGYEHRPDHEDSDHDYFQRAQSGLGAYQIHVCPTGSEWERRHLLFRDHLRTHPDDAERYEAWKRRAAARHPMDILAYIEMKGELIAPIERKLLADMETDP